MFKVFTKDNLGQLNAMGNGPCISHLTWFQSYVRPKWPSEISPKNVIWSRFGHARENGGHGAQSRRSGCDVTLGAGGHEGRPAFIDFGKVGTLIADARHQILRTFREHQNHRVLRLLSDEVILDLASSIAVTTILFSVSETSPDLMLI